MLELKIHYLLVLTATAAFAMPIDPVPVWGSAETTHNFTGAAFADLDRDGDQDFISSAGNDIVSTYNFVWDNQGGELSSQATWQSDDRDFSGHCAVGDLDSDGWIDLAVSNYIGSGWGTTHSQLYRNISGTLEDSPSWTTADQFHSFSCAFGDGDGDGDLDLAFACGEQYNNFQERSRVFFNDGGQLETSASWQTAAQRLSYDTFWVDVDLDGDLDLSFITSEGPVLLYYNHDGVIENTPGWQSGDTDDGNSMCWGDLNNDGYPDLATANNYQLWGDGYFQVYMNQGGTPTSQPTWRSATAGYGSAVILCDYDFDGDLDLATGRWWSRLAIYENHDGVLETNPSWQCHSSYDSVIEEIVAGDVDGDGFRLVDAEAKAVDGQKQVFYMNNIPAAQVMRVRADGMLLGNDDYCTDPAVGWISLATPPSQSLTISYVYSVKPDLGVSNWDRENFLFENTLELSAPIAVRLRGHDLPLSLPGNGGEVSVDYTVVNNLPGTQTVDVWLMARRGANTFGPFLNDNLLLKPRRSVGKGFTKMVPGSAPDGLYTLVLYAGVYPDTPADSSSVELIKGMAGP